MGAVISHPLKNGTKMYGASYGKGLQHKKTLLGFNTLEDAKRHLITKGFKTAAYISPNGQISISLTSDNIQSVSFGNW